jgi:hypothetical protein
VHHIIEDLHILLQEPLDDLPGRIVKEPVEGQDAVQTPQFRQPKMYSLNLKSDFTSSTILTFSSHGTILVFSEMGRLYP